MKKDTPEQPQIDSKAWLALAIERFPELKVPDSGESFLFCEDLAYATNNAHEERDEDFVKRSYEFIRWSMKHTEDEMLKGSIADWFFSRILRLGQSECLDYLDWGDVSAFFDASRDPDPMFTGPEDEHIEGLIEVWRKRWSRNQKLPPPILPPAKPSRR